MYLDDNEKLLKNETLIGINKELRGVDVIINSCKKYYNTSLVSYNKLVKYKEENVYNFLKGENNDG